MAEKVNIFIDQGTTFNTEIEIFQNDDELDLDGYEFYSSIRKLYSSTSYVDFTITKDANNNIQMSLDKTITQDLVPGKYRYDVLMVDTNGTASKILEGLAFVEETFTRTANT